MRRFGQAKSIRLVLLAGAGAAACGIATAQGPSLADQLKAQYRVTKLAADSTGVTVLEPGDVLSIRKAGILGVPLNSMFIAAANYKGGDLHPPGAAARMMVADDNRYLQIGERVYVRKIDVNLKSDKITFLIVECDPCNGVTEFSSYKSEAVFQFPKGFLATAGLAQVQEPINSVFSIEAGGGGSPKAEGADQPGVQGMQAAATLGPVYVNSQNTADRLQLNADGSFSLVEGGQTFTGGHSVTGATLKLHIVELQKDVEIAIEGDRLIVNGDETWVQPGQ